MPAHRAVGLPVDSRDWAKMVERYSPPPPVLRPATVRARDDALELRAQPRPLHLHDATRLPVHGREPRAEQRVQPEDFFEGSGRHKEQVFGFFTPEGTGPTRGLGGGHAGSSHRRIRR